MVHQSTENPTDFKNVFSEIPKNCSILKYFVVLRKDLRARQWVMVHWFESAGPETSATQISSSFIPTVYILSYRFPPIWL